MNIIRESYMNLRSIIPSNLHLQNYNDLEEEILDLTKDCYKQLLLLDEQIMKNENFKFEGVLDEIKSIVQIVLDRTWENLNTGHWSQVPESQRFIYSLGSLFLSMISVMQAFLVQSDQQKYCLEKGLKDADMGLLLGCAYRTELTKAAEILSNCITKLDSPNETTGTSSLICGSLLPEFTGVKGCEIDTLSCPSLETFYAIFFLPRKPVKLEACMTHWPALNKWNSLDYISAKAGGRTVPVEIGSRYDEEEWSQSLMTVREFIRTHITSENKQKRTGYLAQHQLFNQIPELLTDICEPEYCCCSDKENTESGGTDINAWFGPAGTISPLHYDPKHNILAQVVGRKRVILYDPKYSDCLSCHNSKLLKNTAQVDPENPDYKQFPNYKNVPALETILHPGEMLYIPPTWWHHIRSLDVSFSVSFWWE
ncbi:bifunctional peptidase and arginyl-hydroxylase JMJD5 [Nilaparvata lugens]|uniref:bifunctional peptidase and arginyl-hydroxylase JMJD5 n=1 Tax=Nilaparvata lugens TaxID=108931 RepID=UPI00193D7D47|nr:bifunctional peptidase and arginyl-hydroxylase JMJD5 [Nilaparvata lugens]